MATNEELIGRNDVDDLEAILSVPNAHVAAALHVVPDTAAAPIT